MFKVEAYQGLGSSSEPLTVDPCDIDNNCTANNTIFNKPIVPQTVTIKKGKDGKVFITYDDNDDENKNKI